MCFCEYHSESTQTYSVLCGLLKKKKKRKNKEEVFNVHVLRCFLNGNTKLANNNKTINCSKKFYVCLIT